MNERQAREEAAALCARLRERGDEDSIHAASMIEGTLDAFSGLVHDIYRYRERADKFERALDSLRTLWSRVPYEHRMRASHST